MASDQGPAANEDGAPFLARKTNAIPHCFCKCAQEKEKKQVAAILKNVVCTECSQATEKAGVMRRRIRKEFESWKSL